MRNFRETVCNTVGVAGAIAALLIAAPRAAAVLFAGSYGNLGLRIVDGAIKFAGDNFLARSRQLFVDGGVAVAVVDAIVNWMLKKPYRNNID